MPRNNIQNDVKIESQLISHRNKFLKGGLISTSCNIGQIQPTKCNFLQAGTKVVCNTEEMVRTAAMVSPTYGKQKLKSWHVFVPLEDIVPNAPELLTKKSVYRGLNNVSPATMPCAPLWRICAQALRGARATLWYEGAPFDGNTGVTMWKSANSNDVLDDESTHAFTKAYRKFMSDFVTDYNGNDITLGQRAYLDVGALLTNGDDSLVVMLSNVGPTSFAWDTAPKSPLVGAYDYDTTPVSMQGADFKIYFTVDIRSDDDPEDYHQYVNLCLAIRLSTFGIQAHKLLCGLGFGFDLTPNEGDLREVARLYAYYRAYWLIFPRERYLNWETSFANRHIQSFTLNSTPVIPDELLSELFENIACLWVVENVDYIAAHTDQPTIMDVGEIATKGINPIGDVVANNTPNNSDVSTPSYHISAPELTENPLGDYGNKPDYPLYGYIGDGHAHTLTELHGFFDSLLMQKLYKLGNSETALGRPIGRLLRLLGLGEYLQRTRSNFVGYTETPIEVSTVTATSDTFKETESGEEGKRLGEYAGKAIGYRHHKTLKYQTDVMGYYIVLTAMTCDSGYCQGIDETTKMVRDTDFYHPTFDGAGMELAPLSIVAGQMDVARSTSFRTDESSISPNDRPFGWRPRHAGFKVARSCLMGGFSLNSMRKSFISYNMDKTIYPEHREDALVPSEEYVHQFDSEIAFYETRTLPTVDIPAAGDAWRFLGRWPWMGNLLRIFAQTGADFKAWYNVWANPDTGHSNQWEYTYRIDDNYMIFQEFNLDEWAFMEEIANSYGTTEPEPKDNEFIKRN